MEYDIPTWFKLEYLSVLFGGGILLSIYKFSVKADEIYSSWFRLNSKERFSKYVTRGVNEFGLLEAVNMSKGLVDRVFCHSSYGRPRFQRTALFSGFAFLLGLVFSFTYYDKYLVHGDDALNYAWLATVFFIIVGLNIFFDFLSVWFTSFCLSRMVTTVRIYVFSLIDFFVSTILSPFFWLSALAFFYVATPVFDMGSWSSFFPSESRDLVASEIFTIPKEDNAEPIPGLEELLNAEDITPLNLPVYEASQLTWSERRELFVYSLKFGVIVEFLRGPDTIFHFNHVHFYHIIGASLMLGSLFSSVLTSLGVWLIYSSYFFFRGIRFLVSPVVFASKHLDLAAENRPLGCLIAVNGFILTLLFGLFTLLTM